MYLLSRTLLARRHLAHHIYYLCFVQEPETHLLDSSLLSELFVEAGEAIIEDFMDKCNKNDDDWIPMHDRQWSQYPDDFHPDEIPGGGDMLPTLLFILSQNLRFLELRGNFSGSGYLYARLWDLSQLQRLQGPADKYTHYTLQEVVLSVPIADQRITQHLHRMRAFVQIPSLRCITCINIDLDELFLHDFANEATLPTNIEEIYMENVGVHGGAVLAHLTQSLPKLKVLDMSIRGSRLSDLDPDMNSLLEALTHLQPSLENFSLQDLSNRAKPENRQEHVLPSFSAFLNMTSLTIPAWILDFLFQHPKDATIPPHVFNFSILPPNLEDLTLCDVDGTALALLRVLAEPDLTMVLGKLESVHIEFSEDVWRDFRQLERGCKEFIQVFGEMGVLLSIDAREPERKATEMEGERIIVTYR